MTSLSELAKSGVIQKTKERQELPIKLKGITDGVFDVYQIPLDLLFYNDENGRISTGMQNLSQQLEPVPDKVDPSYNDLIASLIEKDNKKALKNTQKSIKEKGQNIFGYVLDDGRIIDGNRRFTALRNLQKETGITRYFKAIILPTTLSPRIIKDLELEIQHGIEPRQKYNDVDYALDIYNSISGENKKYKYTVQDYASKSRL